MSDLRRVPPGVDWNPDGNDWEPDGPLVTVRREQDPRNDEEDRRCRGGVKGDAPPAHTQQATA